MHITTRTIVSGTVLFALLFSLAGCSGGQPVTPNSPVTSSSSANPAEQSDARQTVQTFLSALASDQWEQAYGQTSKEFKDTGPVEKFVSYFKGTPAYATRASFAISALDVNGDQAASAAEDGRGHAIFFLLKKEDGAWKITNMEVRSKNQNSGSGGEELPLEKSSAATSE